MTPPAPGATTAVARLRHLSRRAAEMVGVGLFAALFLVFVLQVAARLLFERPLPWTDELAVILYLVVVLWGAALLVPWRAHVAMDLVVQSVSPGLRRALVFTGAAGAAVLAAWALPATADYVAFMHRERTPVLDWSLMAVYSPALLLLAAIALRGAGVAWQALRGRLPEDSPPTGGR